MKTAAHSLEVGDYVRHYTVSIGWRFGKIIGLHRADIGIDASGLKMATVRIARRGQQAYDVAIPCFQLERAEHPAPSAKYLRQWRQYIGLFATPETRPYWRTQMLCCGVNWAIGTNTQRGARDARAHRKFAKWCRYHLSKNPGSYFEGEDGKLRPVGPR